VSRGLGDVYKRQVKVNVKGTGQIRDVSDYFRKNKI
jgi:hypothetical protein